MTREKDFVAHNLLKRDDNITRMFMPWSDVDRPRFVQTLISLWFLFSLSRLNIFLSISFSLSIFLCVCVFFSHAHWLSDTALNGLNGRTFRTDENCQKLKTQFMYFVCLPTRLVHDPELTMHARALSVCLCVYIDVVCVRLST